MMNDSNTYDVIVVGSGMTGGWAAKEFTEKGLPTLILERGRDVKHIKDYYLLTVQVSQYLQKVYVDIV